MTTGDITGLVLVYLYVILLIIISEKLLKKHLLLGRKFLHIMVGNILFILPLFDTQWVMVLLAAAPFILLTFLISPFSPLNVKSGTSYAGHRLGLVYYSISWTLLAALFFNRLEVIAVGIIAMSYGDGFASLIGQRFGRFQYNVTGDLKSIEGSIAMFFATFVAMVFVLPYFRVSPFNMWLVLLATAALATLAEALAPKGFDNISASLTSAIFYYMMVYVVML